MNVPAATARKVNSLAIIGERQSPSAYGSLEQPMLFNGPKEK